VSLKLLIYMCPTEECGPTRPFQIDGVKFEDVEGVYL
jgi:hypothetical protein